MNNESTEAKIRNFFINDMMKECVRNAAESDELDLDSLDQTELRVFLSEEFGIKFSELQSTHPLTTIKDIMCFIKNHSTLD